MGRKEYTKDEQMVRDMISRMTTTEKIKYYVSTYKWYAISVIAAVLFVYYVIYSVLTAKTEVLYLGILNRSTYCSEVMLDGYYDYSQLNTDKERLALYDSLGSGAEYYEGGYNLYNMYIAADEINLCFTDKEGADFIGLNGIVIDPKTWMSADLYELWKDRIVTVPVVDDPMDMSDEPKKTELAIAIDLTGTKVHKEFKLDEDTNLLICVINNEKFDAELKRYCDFMYAIETGTYVYQPKDIK